MALGIKVTFVRLIGLENMFPEYQSSCNVLLSLALIIAIVTLVSLKILVFGIKYRL